jgi:hypothetical protein
MSMTSTGSPFLDAGEEGLAILDIARCRGRHEVHLPGGHLCFLDQFRVSVDRCEGTPQSVGVELTGRVHALTESYDLQPTLEIG